MKIVDALQHGPVAGKQDAFNVCDYGALGDGSTDDSAAFQACINAAGAYATVVGSLPTWVAAGTFASGTGTVAPGVPAGYAANDIFVMFVETAYNESLTAPSGWTYLGSKATGNVTDATKISVCWKRASASESAPTVADPGDHIGAIIHGFRGCITTGAPFNYVGWGNEDTSDTSGSLPLVGTSVNNCLVVQAVTSGLDVASTTMFSSWTNAALGSVTERSDNVVIDGTGGGIGVVTGTLATAASGGTTTVTYGTASPKAMVSLALMPDVQERTAVVTIPPARYKLSTSLNLLSNVTLSAYGAYMFAGNKNYLVTNFGAEGQNIGYQGHYNIDILGGTWDGKAQNAATDDAYNIMGFYHARNVVIRDATFRNTATWHALELNSTDGGLVESCRFEGFKDWTSGQTRQFSEAIQLDIGSSDFMPGKNITVQRCYVGPAVDGSGLGTFGRLAGSHSDTSGNYFTGIRILDNHLDGSLDNGIQTYAWSDSIIKGNVLRAVGAVGIRVSGNADNAPVNLVITDNVINSSAGAGIELNCTATRTLSYSVISNNTLYNCGASTPALWLKYAYGCTVASNTITGNGNIAISLASGAGNNVNGNTITNSGHDGIRLGADSANMITGNVINTTPQRGIYLTGCGNNNVVSGNFATNCGVGNSSGTTMGVFEISSTCGSDNAFMGNRATKLPIQAGSPPAGPTAAFRSVAGGTTTGTVFMGNTSKGDGSGSVTGAWDTLAKAYLLGGTVVTGVTAVSSVNNFTA